MDAYYAPVVAFARKDLLRSEPGPVYESRVGPNTPKPRLRDGNNIVVDPRGTVGELRTVTVGPPFYAPGEAWAGTNYCLHVLQEGGTTTIVVEELSEWIR